MIAIPSSVAKTLRQRAEKGIWTIDEREQAIAALDAPACVPFSFTEVRELCDFLSRCEYQSDVEFSFEPCDRLVDVLRKKMQEARHEHRHS